MTASFYCHKMLLIFSFVLFYSIQVRSTSVLSCNFEDGTMCEMQNSLWFDPERPVHNFTLTTGENVPDKSLAPMTDHTYNTSSGHFAYWHQPLGSPHTDRDGCLSIPIFELHEHLCFNFAYYIKSMNSIRNGTVLTVSIKGCYSSTLWVIRTDDTLGWKTDRIQLLDLTCNVTIWFNIMADIKNSVSVALDDITIDTCPRYTTTTISGYSPSLAINIYLLMIILIIIL
ncbi:hypothetical protein I4U23_011364 [Adineta vaga]|nr:hypothetical protein I4U23_011364 [Adineta vaga]